MPLVHIVYKLMQDTWKSFLSLVPWMILCPPPPFLFGSKKYLSQKNVVEKMNASVMHGKVRHVRRVGSWLRVLPVAVGWAPLSGVSALAPLHSGGLEPQCVIANCMPLGLFLGASSDPKEMFC